jgi:hypothetical protein
MQRQIMAVGGGNEAVAGGFGACDGRLFGLVFLGRRRWTRVQRRWTKGSMAVEAWMWLPRATVKVFESCVQPRSCPSLLAFGRGMYLLWCDEIESGGYGSTLKSCRDSSRALLQP